MKKLAILITALLLMGLTQAQDAEEAAIVGYTTPNYEQIKKDCTDKHSFRYYPNLTCRRYTMGRLSLMAITHINVMTSLTKSVLS